LYHSKNIVENIIQAVLQVTGGAEMSEDVWTPGPVSGPILTSKQPIFFASVNVHAMLKPPDGQYFSYVKSL